MASANCPRAKINSISETIWQSFRITALLFLICRVSSLRTSITSCFSASISSIRSLFRRTEIIGSIKSVCPVEERSWTIPSNLYRYSSLTGTTYRPLRCVIIASCRYNAVSLSCSICLKDFRILLLTVSISPLIRDSFIDALSRISPLSSKTCRILLNKPSKGRIKDAFSSKIG